MISKIIKKFEMFPSGECIIAFRDFDFREFDWLQFNKELEELKNKQVKK